MPNVLETIIDLLIRLWLFLTRMGQETPEDRKKLISRDEVYLVGSVKDTPEDKLKIVHFNPRTNAECIIGAFPSRRSGAAVASLQSKFVDSCFDSSIIRVCVFQPCPTNSRPCLSLCRLAVLHWRRLFR